MRDSPDSPADLGNTRLSSMRWTGLMRDEGLTQRWFGLIARQFRKVITHNR